VGCAIKMCIGMVELGVKWGAYSWNIDWEPSPVCCVVLCCKCWGVFCEYGIQVNECIYVYRGSALTSIYVYRGSALTKILRTCRSSCRSCPVP